MAVFKLLLVVVVVVVGSASVSIAHNTETNATTRRNHVSILRPVAEHLSDANDINVSESNTHRVGGAIDKINDNSSFGEVVNEESVVRFAGGFDNNESLLLSSGAVGNSRGLEPKNLASGGDLGSGGGSYVEYKGTLPDNYDYSFSNYDYDLTHYDGISPHLLVDVRNPEFYKNLSLRKCNCNGLQTWNGTQCRLHENGTFVAVLDGRNIPIPVNTSWFGLIDVTPLQICPEGYIKTMFSGGNFHLLADLYLMHSISNLITTPEDFCIDHVIDDSGTLSWQAEVCVPVPQVPRCCPEGLIWHALAGQCIQSHNNNTFSPPVLLENTVFSNLDGPVIVVNCSNDKEANSIQLGSDGATLRYKGDGVIFTWSSPGALPVMESIPNYCVAVEDQGPFRDPLYSVQFCYKDELKAHQEICANGTCIRKCCGPGQLFDSKATLCVTPALPFSLWQPTFHSLISGKLIEVQRPEDLITITGKPLCQDVFVLEPNIVSTDQFYLLNNGSLHVPIWDQPIHSTSYCIDNWLYDNDVVIQQAIVCFPEIQQPTACKRFSNIAYPSLLIISSVFLAITLGVYATVPELHAKVHGKSLVSHVSSLLVSYISLVIVQWASNKLPMTACITMASVIHMSFLASFFWLNIMCFDIYWTLRSLRPIAESGDGSRRRFKWYSAYAWGCPLIIGLVTVGMQQQDPEQHQNLVLPGFGTMNCWFATQTALWLYFYGFILVLTITNIIFFMQVAYILIQAQRANKNILKTTARQDKERMKLYVKLFVVMGVTWICEVISWQEGTCELWVVTDIVNSLQGVFIFLIFVCKRNVYMKVRGKCDPGISRVKRIVRTSSSYATTSQTSQRTTHVTLDSIRRSSSSQPPSTTKLSTSSLHGNSLHGSLHSGMHVIPESVESSTSFPSHGYVHSHATVQEEGNLTATSPNANDRQVSDAGKQSALNGTVSEPAHDVSRADKGLNVGHNGSGFSVEHNRSATDITRSESANDISHSDTVVNVGDSEAGNKIGCSESEGNSQSSGSVNPGARKSPVSENFNYNTNRNNSASNEVGKFETKNHPNADAEVTTYGADPRHDPDTPYDNDDEEKSSDAVEGLNRSGNHSLTSVTVHGSLND